MSGDGLVVGELLPGLYRGATLVGHRMLEHRRLAAVSRFQSRCGSFWAGRLIPAADGVPECQRCARFMAADVEHARVLQARDARAKLSP